MPTSMSLCMNAKNSNIQTSYVHDTDTMSSIEIAQISGRTHKDVMRSIRSMEPAWVKVSGRNFALTSYKDEQGKERPCYHLTKEECLYIATKFNDEARAKLVRRWTNLETGKATPMVKPKKPTITPTKIKASIEWIKGVSEILNLSDSSKHLLLEKIAKPLELPLPAYTKSKGIVKSATELLKGSNMTIRQFNQKMIEKGFLTELERKAAVGYKTFKSLTIKGLDYGENMVNPHNPTSTQPVYYEEKFNQLLTLLS